MLRRHIFGALRRCASYASVHPSASHLRSSDHLLRTEATESPTLTSQPLSPMAPSWISESKPMKFWQGIHCYFSTVKPDQARSPFGSTSSWTHRVASFTRSTCIRPSSFGHRSFRYGTRRTTCSHWSSLSRHLGTKTSPPIPTEMSAWYGSFTIASSGCCAAAINWPKTIFASW